MALCLLKDLTVPPVNTGKPRKWLIKQHRVHSCMCVCVCVCSLTRNVSPKVPNMLRHKKRSECPLLPTYRRRNSHRSAVNSTHIARRCRLRCYQMHQTEPGSGETDTHTLSAINRLCTSAVSLWKLSYTTKVLHTVDKLLSDQTHHSYKFSVVTDSESATESADSSRVRPSPNPWIFLRP